MACDGVDHAKRRIRIITKLIWKKVDLEAKDNNGNAALLRAAGVGQTDAMIALIKSGADKSTTNYKKQSAYKRLENCKMMSPKMKHQRKCFEKKPKPRVFRPKKREYFEKSAQMLREGGG